MTPVDLGQGTIRAPLIDWTSTNIQRCSVCLTGGDKNIAPRGCRLPQGGGVGAEDDRNGKALVVLQQVALETFGCAFSVCSPEIQCNMGGEAIHRHNFAQTHCWASATAMAKCTTSWSGDHANTRGLPSPGCTAAVRAVCRQGSVQECENVKIKKLQLQVTLTTT